MPHEPTEFKKHMEEFELRLEKLGGSVAKYLKQEQKALGFLKLPLEFFSSEHEYNYFEFIQTIFGEFGKMQDPLIEVHNDIIALTQIVHEMTEDFYLIVQVIHDMNATNQDLGVVSRG